MQDNWTKAIKTLDIIAIALTAVIVLSYFWVCFKNAINFPMGDDMYQTTIWFQSFYNAPSSKDQLAHYFMQYNSHFLLFHYICAVVDYYIVGHVSYRHLIIVGNLLMLAVWYLLFKQFRQDDKPNYLLFLPATMVLFTPVDQMVNWAATAAHNGGMIFFGLFSLWAFTKQNSKWSLLAVSALFISMFSLVGGIAVPIAGLIMFFFLPNKNYKQLGIWVVASLLFYLLFFSIWENIVIAKHKTDITKAILLFFSFLGSAATFESKFRVMAPVIGGLSSLVCLFALFRTKYFRARPGILGALLFMAGIATFTAIGRNYLGPLVAIKNKYYWMQAVFTACVYMTFIKLPIFEGPKKQLIGIFLLLLFVTPVFFSTYKKELRIINKSRVNTIDFVNKYNRELKKGDHGVYHAANIQIIVNRAIREGYFSLPDFYEGRPVEAK